MLREQLDQATEANQALNENVQKLTEELTRTKDEYEDRENEWREEEKVKINVWFLKYPPLLRCLSSHPE